MKQLLLPPLIANAPRCPRCTRCAATPGLCEHCVASVSQTIGDLTEVLSTLQSGLDAGLFTEEIRRDLQHRADDFSSERRQCERWLSQAQLSGRIKIR